MNRHPCGIIRSDDSGVLLMVGGDDREEFQAPRQAIRILARGRGIEPIETRLPLDFDLLSGKECVAIVLCESYPGSYSQCFLRRLRRLFPLTPVILLAGDLCEGEGRTGDLPPGIVRVCRRQWREFVKDDLEPFLTGGTGRLALPPIAADEDYLVLASRPLGDFPPLLHGGDSPAEAIAFRSPDSDPKEAALAPICVVSPFDHALGEMIAEIWRQRGKGSETFTADSLLAAREKRPGDPERIVVDSVARKSADELPTIKKLSAAFPRTQIDLLLFAPRIEDERLFVPLTNVRLIAKPFV